MSLTEKYGTRTSIETVREGALTVYRVEAWGQPPYDYSRVYTIRARNPEDAASEGAEMFNREVFELLGETPAP